MTKVIRIFTFHTKFHTLKTLEILNKLPNAIAHLIGVNNARKTLFSIFK